VIRRKRRLPFFSKVPGDTVYMQLRVKQSEVTKKEHVVEKFHIPFLNKHIREFLLKNVCGDASDPESDANNLINNCMVEAFSSVEIPVPQQDTGEQNAYVLHHLRCTGMRAWRGQNGR